MPSSGAGAGGFFEALALAFAVAAGLSFEADLSGLFALSARLSDEGETGFYLFLGRTF